jgi:hypothetical protein
MTPEFAIWSGLILLGIATAIACAFYEIGKRRERSAWAPKFAEAEGNAKAVVELNAQCAELQSQLKAALQRAAEFRLKCDMLEVAAEPDVRDPVGVRLKKPGRRTK